MRRIALTCIALIFMLGALALGPVSAAQGEDPDWPCIQRKVPELSLGQIWSGPELPAAASDWSKDARVADLVEELAARRMPLQQAQREISSFAKGLPEGERERRLVMLLQGLFDHMNRERADVISGIGRYARGQKDMAAFLRRQASEVDALRSKPDADPNALVLRNDRLVFQTRIFQERAQSLTYVCEVPTLIEQRLYALAKAIAEQLGSR